MECPKCKKGKMVKKGFSPELRCSNGACRFEAWPGEVAEYVEPRRPQGVVITRREIPRKRQQFDKAPLREVESGVDEAGINWLRSRPATTFITVGDEVIPQHSPWSDWAEVK